MRTAVEVVEPLGASVLITARIGGQVVKVQAPATFVASAGEELPVDLPIEQCRWYDPETSVKLEIA